MKIFEKRKSFLKFIPIIFVVILIHCSREKSLTAGGYEKEKNGNISEALYDYHRALTLNPDFAPANKRIGIILSESQLSTIVAINHLEKAFQSDNTDLEVGLRLLDLYLFAGDSAKFKKLLQDSKNLVPEESKLFLQTLETCLFSEKEKAKAVAKIDTLIFPNELKYYYRSLSLCYEKNGFTEKAEKTAIQYKKMNRAK